MKFFTDFEQNIVRLTDERLEHILLHPEMKDMIEKIEETIAEPDYVIQSISDYSVKLFNKFYITHFFGGKFHCVIVKYFENDAFIITSFIINDLPKGDILWQKS